MAETLKLPVHALQSGDVTTGSGETIVSVSAGARTARGKMGVVLEKAGRRRTSVWGRHTAINVTRESRQ